jgi:DNA primase
MAAHFRASDRDDAVEQVREATDLVALVSETVSLKRSGANLVGLCPFHQERTPSFTVSPARQVFHCFGCGAGGDAFRYVMLAEGLTFRDALGRLAERAGIALPERGGTRGERGRLTEVLERATVLYERCLAHPTLGARARAYLERRGLSSETATRFRVGYAPPAWDTLVSRAGDEIERLVTVGLAIKAEHGRIYDRFRDRVVFPVMDSSGRVVGHGARLLEGEGAKYLNSPETPLYRKGKTLYGLPVVLPALREVREAVVVEGYTDLLALYQAGIRNVVAGCGTAFTDAHAAALGRLVERAVLAYDADPAGRAAAERAAAVLLDRGFAVRVATLPDGCDPDQLAREHGADVTRRVLDGAKDALAWVATAQHEPDQSASARMQRVVRFVAQVNDPLRRHALAQDAARALRFPESVVVEGVEHTRQTGRGEAVSRRSAAPAVPAVPARREEPLAKRKDRLLALCLAHPAIGETAVARLGHEAFESPLRREIATAIQHGDSTSQEAAAWAARLMLEGGEISREEAERELRGHVVAIRTYLITREMKTLAEEIQRRTASRTEGETGTAGETRALEDRLKLLNEELSELTHA